MIKTLFTSSTSAAFEWQNDLPYYKEKEYKIYIGEKEVYSGNTNVFSLFDLTPNTEYTIICRDPELQHSFSTKKESAVLNVLDFGATGDGKTDDTIAIQTAINCLPKDARLYFPKGIYLSGALCLKSHITLDIPEGTELLGSTDRTKYPIIPGKLLDMQSGEEVHLGTWEGNAVPMHQALLFAQHAEDITIVGRGKVNGNADIAGWWINVKEQPYGRPRLMFFNRCDKINVHGIHGCNAASWQMHPYFSKNVSFYDMFISAPKDSPNTDAIDPMVSMLTSVVTDGTGTAAAVCIHRADLVGPQDGLAGYCRVLAAEVAVGLQRAGKSGRGLAAPDGLQQQGLLVGGGKVVLPGDVGKHGFTPLHVSFQGAHEAGCAVWRVVVGGGF